MSLILGTLMPSVAFQPLIMRNVPSAAAVTSCAAAVHQKHCQQFCSYPMFATVAPLRLQQSTMLLSTQTMQALVLNSALGAAGHIKGQRVLTLPGLWHSWALGVMLWGSLGWRGWSTCVLYMLCGSMVTKVKKAKKEALGISESAARGGARGPENVWGSAATAAVCALTSVVCPAQATLLRIAFVAALATKLSDTCASEIGKAFGKTTYLITTMRLVPPGTEGAVSLEGTLAGFVGSIVLSVYAVGCGLIGPPALIPCLLAAIIATTAESFIGAVAQDKFRLLTNEVVNFIMTVIGAAAAISLALVLRVA